MAWEQLGQSRKQISCIYVRYYTCLSAELFILHLLFFVVPCFASSKCFLRRLHDKNGGDVYLAFNAHDYFVKVSIPPPPPKRRWLRVVSVSSISGTYANVLASTCHSLQLFCNWFLAWDLTFGISWKKPRQSWSLFCQGECSWDWIYIKIPQFWLLISKGS